MHTRTRSHPRIHTIYIYTHTLWSQACEDIKRLSFWSSTISGERGALCTIQKACLVGVPYKEAWVGTARRNLACLGACFTTFSVLWSEGKIRQTAIRWLKFNDFTGTSRLWWDTTCYILWVILCACAGRDTRSAFCESEGALEGGWSGSQPGQGAALGALGWCPESAQRRLCGSLLRAKRTHGFSSVPSLKLSWRSFRCRGLNQLKSEVIVNPPCFSMFASSLDWKNDIVGADFSTISRFQQWRWEGQNPRIMAFLCWRGSGLNCCCWMLLDIGSCEILGLRLWTTCGRTYSFTASEFDLFSWAGTDF